jgi:hypothetical protein
MTTANNPATLPANDETAGQTPAVSPSLAGDPLAGLVDEMQATAPAVSERFAAKLAGDEAATAAQPATAKSAVTDSAGYVFDSRYCATDETGQPKTTPAGRFVMKRNRAGTRHPKSLLKKAGAKTATVKRPAGPRAKLVLPADLGEQPEPGADLGGTASPPPPLPPFDEKRMQAEQLAEVIDGTYWNLSNLYADGAAVAAYRDQLSQPGRAALADGFYRMENVPEVPWWVIVAAIYAPASVGMFNHPASAPKKTRIMEKLAAWWVRVKSRKDNKRAPAAPGERSRAGENAPDLDHLGR